MSLNFRYRSDFPDHLGIFEFPFKTVSEIKDDCIYMLDASALLTLYDTGPKILENVKAIYILLAKEKRLLVPAQAIREFLANRSNKLIRIYKSLIDKSSETFTFFEKFPLLTQIEGYHNLDLSKTKVEAAITEYRAELKKIISVFPDIGWNDPISNMYQEVLTDLILPDVKMDNDSLEADLKRRNEQKIPPGFKDKDKQINAGGDLEIWQSILEVASSEKKNLIFVSGDVKEDWVTRSNDHTLFPQLQLIDEYRRVSGGMFFHIIDLASLLKLFNGTPDAIREVSQAEKIYGSIIAASSFSDLQLKDRVFSLIKEMMTSVNNYYTAIRSNFASNQDPFLSDKFLELLLIDYNIKHKNDAIILRDEIFKRGITNPYSTPSYEEPKDAYGLQNIASHLELLVKYLDYTN